MDDFTPWGPIGQIIYLRTYARPNDLLGRRERWSETVERVIRYTQTLGPTTAEEIAEFRAAMLGLTAFPAGRTLWIADTPIAYQHPEANMNCAFEVLDDAKAFHDLTLLLMSGSGVGFRVLARDVARLNAELPLPETPKPVIIQPYRWRGFDSPSYTTTTIVVRQNGTATLVVGDSREGWADAIRFFLEELSARRPSERIEVVVDSVRPKGAPLKTFGGYASGPEPLLDLFRLAPLILYDRNRPAGWTDTKALDIANLVGRTVVSGGTRRSALIALGESEEFARAKTGEWASEGDLERWVRQGHLPADAIPPWRVQSNNSLMFFDHPGRTRIAEIMESVLQYGEPGFINAAEALRRRKGEFAGVNPCSEILLRDHGFCNLATVNLRAFVEGRDIDLQSLGKALDVLTRHAMRITNISLGPRLAEWDRVQREDRLIGISMTGMMDAIAAAGLSEETLSAIWEWGRERVHETARNYAAEMGIQLPKLMTTVKPEGTLSLLPGVSSGIHDAYAPFYLRRVRISEDDAVAQALIRQGFPHEPDLFAPNTQVFTFPIRTPARRSSLDVPALEMLERYRRSMSRWTDHNTSITVAIGEDEVEDVVDWLDRNWDSIVGISFLPKSREVYPQQPYEAISEDEYHAWAASMPEFDRSVLDEIESAAGAILAVDDVDSDCDSGHCPVR